jgi:3',5'-cyclic AMP phosphodiesterase CpdA
MLIVQISDLHVGSQFLQDKFDQLVEEVNQLHPDVIVVTGDLTNEGLMQEYEECKILLTKFNTKKNKNLIFGVAEDSFHRTLR